MPNFVLQIQTMSDKKEVSITFRTTEEISKKIEALAEKEKRSKSQMIEILIEKGLLKVKEA